MHEHPGCKLSKSHSYQVTTTGFGSRLFSFGAAPGYWTGSCIDCTCGEPVLTEAINRLGPFSGLEKIKASGPPI